jgi:hypothetical protein
MSPHADLLPGPLIQELEDDDAPVYVASMVIPC